jgi:endonuclease/exonuclease/phosphatase (EEP) superfamily protein YafD
MRTPVLFILSCSLLLVIATRLPAAEITLRVMSWNLEGWNQNTTSAAAQAAQMASSGAQVIGTQECESTLVPTYQSELQRLTGKTWYVSPPPNPNTSGPIFSIFPFIETEGRDIGRNSWGADRSAVRVKIRVNGTILNVFDTHLDIGLDPDYGEGYRTENVNNIMPWINSYPGPRIFVGDMNSHWDTPWITQIENDFIDTWSETGNPQGWSAPPTNSANWRPDYIFRSKDSTGVIRTVNSWVIGTDWTLSDHRPIVADLAVASGGGPVEAPYGGTAWTIPGTIQAENYDTGGEGLAYHDTSTVNQGGQYRSDGVGISTTADAGGGYIVGWVAPGEWLNYSVTVASTGTYNLGARVACSGPGGTFHIEIDGVHVTSALTVPNTGGWDVGWTIVSATGINLTAGPHLMRLVEDAVGSSGVIGNFNYFIFTAAPPPETPYGGSPWSIPGTIQAENYDVGGEGVAYHTTLSTNNGAQYRNDGVSIESCSDSGGGYDVGWITAGEWLAYSVNIAQSGSYTFNARVASAVSGTKTMHIEIDGVNVTGAMSFTNASGWQAWQNINASTINLTAGAHRLVIVMDTGGFNVNSLSITTAETPYGGSPWSIPGTIQAENYDVGGEGVAYHTTSSTNNGGQYRNDGVSIEACSDSGGGFDVGWITAGEWLAYSVNVTQSGSYTFNARVASAVSGTKTLHVEIDGVNVTGAMSFTNASGWQAWQSITASTINLTGGAHRLVIVMDTGGFNVNSLSMSAGGANSPPVITSGAFATPNPAQSGDVITFATAASDANGDALTYSWNFGDGATGSGSSTSHAYAIAGTYTAAVTVSDSHGGSAASTVSLTVTARTWIDADVGAVGVAGSFAQNGGVFSVRASGLETVATDDAFHYVYQQLSGDGQIIARVSSIQNTSDWAEAGVMIRESLASNSRYVQMMVTQIDRCKFRRRYSAGGSVTSSGLSPGSGMRLPQWLKLVRQGNTFTGYRSDDGANWIVIGTDTVAMNSSVLIGLTDSSANNTVLGGATLDNVALGGAVAPAGRALTSPTSGTNGTVDLGVVSLGDKEPVHVCLPVSPPTSGAPKWKSAALPKGLKFAIGILTGIPKASGSYSFKVKSAAAQPGSKVTAVTTTYKLTIVK